MKKILYAIFIAAVVFSFAVSVRTLLQRDKVMYVDLGKLHEQFKLKKELESKSNAKLLGLKSILDSCQLAKRLEPNSASYTSLDTTIVRLQYELNRQYAESNQQITQQVWDRLNPAIQQYGVDRGFDLVIGANGTGTILYGDADCDATDDLIKYVNSVYEKGS